MQLHFEPGVPVYSKRGTLFALLLIGLIARVNAQNEDLASRSQLARQAMAQGRFEDAVALYSKLVRALPNNPAMILNLGLALHSAGRFREAAAQFREVLNRQPQSVPASLMLGLAYQKMGSPGKALEPLQRVLRAEPENKIALLELGDACLSLNRAEEAVSSFRRLSEVDPRHPKAWQGLGLSYAALSRQAFADLERTAPESPYWHMVLGSSRADRGRYGSAYYLYRQAAGRNPNLRGAHAALAEIYRKTGHPDWAEVEDGRERALPPPDCASQPLECAFLAGRFAEVVALTQNNPAPEALFWRTRALVELSASALGRLGRLPPSAEIHELMARAYRIQGMHQSELREWQEALKLAPEDRRLKRELARSLWLNRDYTQAQPLLEELIKTEPESPQLNHELGDTLLRTRPAEDAIPYLEKAVKCAPGLLPARASLAMAYVRGGRYREAIPHLRAAMPIDEDGGLRYQLAIAYQRGGRETLARKALEEYEAFRKSLEARQRKQDQEYKIAPP